MSEIKRVGWACEYPEGVKALIYPSEHVTAKSLDQAGVKLIGLIEARPVLDALNEIWKAPLTFASLEKIANLVAQLEKAAQP